MCKVTTRNMNNTKTGTEHYAYIIFDAIFEAFNVKVPCLLIAVSIKQR